MATAKKVARQHKPTGQEMDQEYDELHKVHEVDDLLTPEERQQAKDQELEDYSEDLKDPD